MYAVENYGSGMTPFYTNLALWVGGLILVSILKQEVDRDGEDASDLRHRQVRNMGRPGCYMLR